MGFGNPSGFSQLKRNVLFQRRRKYSDEYYIFPLKLFHVNIGKKERADVQVFQSTGYHILIDSILGFLLTCPLTAARRAAWQFRPPTLLVYPFAHSLLPITYHP